RDAERLLDLSEPPRWARLIHVPDPQPGTNGRRRWPRAEHNVLRTRRRVAHRSVRRAGRLLTRERMPPVVAGTTSWVAQHLIGVADRPKPLRASAKAAAVRMRRPRRTPVGASDLIRRRLPPHTQHAVRIPRLATRHQ